MSPRARARDRRSTAGPSGASTVDEVAKVIPGGQGSTLAMWAAQFYQEPTTHTASAMAG